MNSRISCNLHPESKSQGTQSVIPSTPVLTQPGIQYNSASTDWNEWTAPHSEAQSIAPDDHPSYLQAARNQAFGNASEENSIQRSEALGELLAHLVQSCPDVRMQSVPQDTSHTSTNPTQLNSSYHPAHSHLHGGAAPLTVDPPFSQPHASDQTCDNADQNVESISDQRMQAVSQLHTPQVHTLEDDVDMQSGTQDASHPIAALTQSGIDYDSASRGWSHWTASHPDDQPIPQSYTTNHSFGTAHGNAEQHVDQRSQATGELCHQILFTTFQRASRVSAAWFTARRGP